MARFDIRGVWEGEYSYFPREGLPVLPPTTRFKLRARAGCFGIFRGVIRDDPAGGPPQPARVEGRVAGQAVTFTKRYPTLFLCRGGRCVSLAEYLESEEGLPLDAEVSGPPILYEGPSTLQAGASPGSGDCLRFGSGSVAMGGSARSGCRGRAAGGSCAVRCGSENLPRPDAKAQDLDGAAGEAHNVWRNRRPAPA